MQWNWQHINWPDFSFQAERLAVREVHFLRQSGIVVGSVRHLDEADRLQVIIEMMSTEAIKTSEIEGELLDRDSVQASLIAAPRLRPGRGCAPGCAGRTRHRRDAHRPLPALRRAA